MLWLSGYRCFIFLFIFGFLFFLFFFYSLIYHAWVWNVQPWLWKKHNKKKSVTRGEIKIGIWINIVKKKKAKKELSIEIMIMRARVPKNLTLHNKKIKMPNNNKRLSVEEERGYSSGHRYHQRHWWRTEVSYDHENVTKTQNKQGWIDAHVYGESPAHDP